jgi:hypothetical protein
MVKALIDLLLFVALMVVECLKVLFTVGPGLVRLAIIGAVVWSAVMTFGPVWAAYGGEAVSLLPAMCLILAPTAFALQLGGRQWGALAVGAAGTWLAGVAVVALPYSLRGLVVVGVLAAIVVRFVSEGVIREA